LKEQVNHPSHYNQSGRKECIVEMEEKFGPKFTTVWCYITAYKYLYRAGSKDDNPMEQDMSKAQWYMDYAEKLSKKWRSPTNFDTELARKIVMEEYENVKNAGIDEGDK